MTFFDPAVLDRFSADVLEQAERRRLNETFGAHSGGLQPVPERKSMVPANDRAQPMPGILGYNR